LELANSADMTKKAEKEQEAPVVSVLAITILATDITLQSSQPVILTQLNMVRISFNYYN
jgi:hypothetical protein